MHTLHPNLTVPQQCPCSVLHCHRLSPGPNAPHVCPALPLPALLQVCLHLLGGSRGTSAPQPYGEKHGVTRVWCAQHRTEGPPGAACRRSLGKVLQSPQREVWWVGLREGILLEEPGSAAMCHQELGTRAPGRGVTAGAASSHLMGKGREEGMWGEVHSADCKHCREKALHGLSDAWCPGLAAQLLQTPPVMAPLQEVALIPNSTERSTGAVLKHCSHPTLPP